MLKSVSVKSDTRNRDVLKQRLYCIYAEVSVSLKSKNREQRHTAIEIIYTEVSVSVKSNTRNRVTLKQRLYRIYAEVSVSVKSDTRNRDTLL